MSNPPATLATVFISDMTGNFTAGEVALQVARSSYTVHDDNAGTAPSTLERVWLMSLVMSPQIAVHLHTLLGNMLMDYQARYGKIPVDPDYTRRLSEALRATASAPELPQ